MTMPNELKNEMLGVDCFSNKSKERLFSGLKDVK